MLRRFAATVALVCAIALSPGSVRAHVVFGSTTLRLMTFQSDLVARVRIVDPAATLSLDKGKLRIHYVDAEILEVLKGSIKVQRLRFAQQGHGVVQYTANEEVIVFATPIAKSRELSTSRIAEEIDWVSEQESGAEFRLDETTRGDITDAVNEYVALERLPARSQPDTLRRITLRLLTSSHQLLSTSALRDLVFAQDAEIIKADDLAALLPILERHETPIGVRIGILAELERRRLVEAPNHWAKLLSTTSGTDRLSVVRAAAAHPSDLVADELSKLIEAKDIQLVAAVAVSLGSMKIDRVVSPLVGLLASGESRVRMAAVRGLGRVDTESAVKALEVAAKEHADPATRRRALAELRVVRPKTPEPSHESSDAT